MLFRQVRAAEFIQDSGTTAWIGLKCHVQLVDATVRKDDGSKILHFGG